MKTRIKTKQEFIAEGKHWQGSLSQPRPENWGPQMDYLFGLPAEVTDGYQVLHPDLTDGDPKWYIHEYHLTTDPHPYTLGDFKVRVSNKAEWDMVDARCKAMGFDWRSQTHGRCEYDEQPGIFIRKGALTTASGTDSGREYFDHDDALELTLEQFREGFAPDKVVEEKLDAYIREGTLRVWREGHGLKIISSTDTAYKYNLMDEANFNRKHTPELKLGDFKVMVRGDNVHVGCINYSKDHLKIVRDILSDAKHNNIGPKAILDFIEKHGDTLGL